VIPVAATLIVVTASTTVQFSRAAGSRPAGLAGRSLKTQQHAPAAATRYAQLAGPGPVDVLGRTVGCPANSMPLARPSKKDGEAGGRRRCRAVRAPSTGAP